MRIALRGLWKRFGGQDVLRGVEAEVGEGQTVAVLGASGSGKTTLLRLIAGLETPDEGRVELDGRVASRRGWALAPHRRGLGFAFQASALWPHMTVAENIGFGLRSRRDGRLEGRVAALLEALGLQGLGERFPDELSGGQARRVALARAMAPEPRCLLLDEPLTNLEPELKDRLLAVLREEIGRIGASAVYVTHDRTEAEALGGASYRLADGLMRPLDGAPPREEAGP